MTVAGTLSPFDRVHFTVMPAGSHERDMGATVMEMAIPFTAWNRGTSLSNSGSVYQITPIHAPGAHRVWYSPAVCGASVVMMLGHTRSTCWCSTFGLFGCWPGKCCGSCSFCALHILEMLWSNNTRTAGDVPMATTPSGPRVATPSPCVRWRWTTSGSTRNPSTTLCAGAPAAGNADVAFPPHRNRVRNQKKTPRSHFGPTSTRYISSRDALEGAEVPAPLPLQDAQPMPSHCLPDAKCRPQWHL